MTFNRIKFFATASLFAVVFVTGCQKPDYPAAVPATTGAVASARALFVNASPNSPALTFLVENQAVAQNLGLGQSSPYVAIPTGNVQFRAIAGSGSIGGILGSRDILFRAGATNQTNFGSVSGTNYTVFVTDTIQRPAPTTPAGATNPGGPQFLIVTDVLSQTLAANASGVRFFHLASDGSAVSVRLSVPTSATGVPATVTSFLNRAYRNTATATFTSVPAGTYRVDVFAGAIIPTVATTAPVLSTTVTVEATKLYTVFAQGLLRTRTLGVGRVQHN